MREMPRLRRLRGWTLVAVFVLLAGSIGAVLAARAVAAREVSRSHDAFAATSADVASTLELALQHEDDLNLSVGAFLMDHPGVSNAQFSSWSTDVQAFQRYPGLLGFGYTELVPASKLSAYIARATADPVGMLGPGGTFQIIPAGRRPFYCFAKVGQMRPGTLTIPSGYDFCAADPSLASRDSGVSDYTPLPFGGRTVLAIQTPMYRGGALPATIPLRRAAFTGWVGMLTSPTVLLDRAVAAHPDVAVAFRYRASSSPVVFRAGRVPAHAQSMVQDLHNGWTVTTYAAAPAARPTSGGALTTLLAGVALSALLAALVYILATGRARAFALVSQKTAELRHQALHDALTDLPNRALIMDRIDRMLVRSRRLGTDIAALFIDLDEFKNVNDTLGHAAGDRLLQQVADRLTACLRDADTIGRLGGDEFVVLLESNALPLAPHLVAERVLGVMREPFDLDDDLTPVAVTASIGIAVASLESTASDLLRQADMALYQAKARGRNCHEMFHDELGSEIQRRYDMEFDLRGALERHQYRLVYQPIYKLADLEMIGVEALLRWDHPTRGLVQPNDFIPVLESSGQIIDVGRWVLHEACTQMAAWRAGGHDLIVSVNVSARQLEHDIIVRDVQGALADSGLDPSALTIEITETALMHDVQNVADRLTALKALGVQLAIDDFGTGYSSLSYLQRFPIDCLKLDRTFTEAITRSSESEALVHTLVQLGKDLGLKTLAEGVESTVQIDYLRGEGVSEVQGFLLARPLEPQTVATLFLSGGPGAGIPSR